MANELAPFAVWTFASKCAIPSETASILLEGEAPYAAYKTIRDVALFTNKRLIVSDAQGITGKKYLELSDAQRAVVSKSARIAGKKVEVFSLPWSAVNMWSSENAGKLDLNAEIELWTRAGHIKINLGRDVNVRELDALIASAILG